MGKRKHDEYAGPSNDAAGAISVLLKRSKDIVQCLEILQEQDGKPNEALTASLTKLSKKVAPAWQTLASNTSSVTTATEEPPLKVKKREPVILTQWTASDVSKELPPLPPILDKDLEEAAFTHMGYSVRMNYETMEWLGDAYLYLISTSFIFQTFPHLTPGRMSQMRERLYRNATLGEYARRYGFDKRAKIPIEFIGSGRDGGSSATSAQRAKIYGDIFEAYVGAIILSDPENGVATASSWLKALWSTRLKTEILRDSHAAHPRPAEIPHADAGAGHYIKEGANAERPAPDAKNAKVQLTSQIAIKGIEIRYEDIEQKKEKRDKLNNLRVFKQGVYLTGWGEVNKLLAMGEGRSKKDAGIDAAQRALDNKKMISVYQERKMHFLENQKAQESVAKSLEDSLL